MASQHINVKEAMIAALAVSRWGHLCRNRTIYLYIDNQCAVWALNKATCRSEVVMGAIREMFWASVKYNFVVGHTICQDVGTSWQTVSPMH